eukprot:358020-Chlamydomonas_euryale.AAC.12
MGWWHGPHVSDRCPSSLCGDLRGLASAMVRPSFALSWHDQSGAPPPSTRPPPSLLAPRALAAPSGGDGSCVDAECMLANYPQPCCLPQRHL